uniref:BTB domain-containing protein n=1 Tax=Panagrolaimus sp. PS1159 TaxID=55785 RepID=A0AC35GB50_9BILA
MESSEFIIIKKFKFNKSDFQAVKDFGALCTSRFFVSAVPGIRYFLTIFPNGYKEEHRGETWFFLCIELPSGMKVDAEVKFTVASANFTIDMKQRYDKSIGWGAFMCSKASLFDPTKNFFAADSLIFKVMGSFKVDLPPKIAYPISFQWKIKESDLAALKDSKNGCLKSKKFIVSLNPNIYFFFSIFPNGYNDECRGKTYICSYTSIGTEAIVKFSIDSANYAYIFQYFFEQNLGCGTFPCSTEDLFKPKNQFIVDGEMIVKAVGTLFISKDREPTVMALEKGIVQKGYHRGRNFTIVVGDKCIKIHKHVLKAASPVFIAMFDSGMKETVEKTMVINDFEYEVVHAAMKLLYSTSIPTTFNFEQMLSLLQFADKYAIELIKNLVQDYLITKISSTNVCSLILFTKTIVLANRLQQKCVNFIIMRLKAGQPVHGMETLDKDIMVKILMELSTHSL